MKAAGAAWAGLATAVRGRLWGRIRIHTWLALLLVLLLSVSGAGAATSPAVDAFGRPLSDAQGPISYAWEKTGWAARRADGSVAFAPGPACGTSSDGDRDGCFKPAPALSSGERAAGSAVASSYTLAPYTAIAVGSWAEAVSIGDVTGDGRNDVVLTTTHYFDPANDNHVFVFPQLTNGTLGAPTKYPYLAAANRNGILLADLNEDGTLDVVVGHGSGITVLLADGVGGLQPGLVVPDADADTLAAMDVTRDGHVDVISLGWSRGATIFFGNGLGGFPTKQALTTNASGYNDQEVEDLTGDGIPDLAVMSGQLYVTPNLTLHRHDGIGAFLPVPDTYFMDTNQLSGGIGLGDVSGDGLHDAVLSRGRNSPTYLWIMTQDGSGSLSGPTTITSYDIPESVEVADLNGDGREDVAVVHGGWLRLGIYLQRSTGGLDPETLYPIPYASHYAPQGLAVGDFSGDGCADVAIADYNFGLVVLRGQNCSAPPTPSAPAGTPTPIATATPTPIATATATWATPVPTGPPCPLTPRPDCTAADRSVITLRNTVNPARNRLKWVWRGTVGLAEFGSPPTSTSFRLCVYDDSVLVTEALVLSGGTCDGRDCWKTISRGNGYVYRNRQTNTDGVRGLLLKAGDGGARITLNAKGVNLAVPGLPLAQSTDVTAQLVKDAGSGPECWGSVFAPPPRRSTDRVFRDVGP